jgi:hypothetical protein
MPPTQHRFREHDEVLCGPQAFSVAEDDPPTTKMRLEHTVLGLEAFDERVLLPGEPQRVASLHQAAASCFLDLDRISGL